MSRDRILPTFPVAFVGTVAITALLVACKETTAPRIAGSLTVTSATTQSALAGTPVAAPPAVVVLDQDGQPLAGAQVIFLVTEGGGTVTGSPATTDAAGSARLASWTLGSTGGLNVVRATAGGIFTHFQATALAPTTLEATSAQAQQATAGSAVASAPAIRVLDQNGQPLAGVTVRFDVTTGGGSLSSSSPVSDANGIATAGSWVVGTVAGANVVTATVGAFSTTFAATSIAGPAARIAYVSGSQQTATVHTTLPLPFVGRVTDQYGNAVKGAGVVATVTGGQDVGARVSPTSIVSANDGSVQTTLTLGDSAGPHEVSMTLSGLQAPATLFTAAADWRRLRATSTAGMYETLCAGGPDGAYCWGAGTEGQIGDGARTDRAIATRVGATVGLVSAAAGVWASCGLDAAGKAYCWGPNYGGELGDGTGASSPTPVAVAGGHVFREISVGLNMACGVSVSDTVYCWGGNAQGAIGAGAAQLTSASPVAVQGNLLFRNVSVGFGHACGLTLSGGVYCWGWNSSGQTGNGDTVSPQTAPVPIVASGKTFITVAAGQFNTCALDQEGAAYCWGTNDMGALGIPTTTPSSATPVGVSGTLRFTQLYAATNRYCGAVATGQVYCWGYLTAAISPPAPQVGPVEVPAMRGWTSLAGHSNTVCGIQNGMDAYCIGFSDRGEAGDGVATTHLLLTPVRVRAP